jgi:hypothetical protein
LKHPNKLIFVDEVGSNTSQAKGGQKGGEKVSCIGTAARPQQRSAMKDAHFTVLGFTAAEGTPVMCAIIFAAKELELTSWVQGINPFVEWHGNENDFNLNTGKGKRYPQGTVCVLNGKHVPTLCCCFSLELFDRSDGINPFLILDGHGSRFDCSFLEYINSPLTPWSVCIGVPYETYWQVGDLSEQNGSFKMELTVAKRDLLTKKTEHDLLFAIEKSYIAALVSTA